MGKFRLPTFVRELFMSLPTIYLFSIFSLIKFIFYCGRHTYSRSLWLLLRATIVTYWHSALLFFFFASPATILLLLSSFFVPCPFLLYFSTLQLWYRLSPFDYSCRRLTVWLRCCWLLENSLPMTAAAANRSPSLRSQRFVALNCYWLGESEEQSI